MAALNSWGRLSHDDHQLHWLLPDNTQHILTKATPGIAHGMGRSYGDVCLNPGAHVWMTRQLNHFTGFDENTGILTCEAGVLLNDINNTFLPQGWLLPVNPGTGFVTVGGAIANDVHGKNHHRAGSFGDHVISIDLLRTDGEQIHCHQNHPDGTRSRELLRASIGGLGLTGLIQRADLQLRRVNNGWLDTNTVAFNGLERFFELADSSEADWEYTVAWIDCLSNNTRGIFLRANHCAGLPPGKPATWQLSQAKKGIPFTPPLSLVNTLSLRLFNEYYYRRQRARSGAGISEINSFFYPLDGITNWNRLYGKRGFYQYQCVIPHHNRLDATRELLACIARAGEGSMLSVLKTFGQRPAPGLLSFPMHGATLALDFPCHRGQRQQRTLGLFKTLDTIVANAGGRLYAAKDARMSAELFSRSYQHLADFLPWRDAGIQSAMSQRLLPAMPDQDLSS